MNKVHKKIFFCEFCSFKTILNEDELCKNFVEIKLSPLQKKIPNLELKKEEKPKKNFKNQTKKFKCPKCGRGVVVKDLQGAYIKTVKEIEIKQEKDKQKADRQQRIEDGKPPEKRNIPDF